jgi:hypothetical protein
MYIHTYIYIYIYIRTYIYIYVNMLKAAERVVEIFKHMQKGGIKLDTVGYSSLLTALSRSQDIHAPFKAEEVFNQMLGAGVQAGRRCLGNT